jgi:DNA-3-methyladenine glycosylase (3mg)
MKSLNRKFYERDTLEVVKDLIGKYLVRQYNGEYIVGQVTEAEAYIGAIDKACHAYDGKKTERTKVLYEKGGTCYVYLIYGMYYCMNIVTEKEGAAAAILLRGVKLIEGRELAAKLRYGKELNELTKYQLKNFSNGPGKLCKALNISKSNNMGSFCSEELFIVDEWNEHKPEKLKIKTSPRIGIDYAEEAKDFNWRFYVED